LSDEEYQNQPPVRSGNWYVVHTTSGQEERVKQNLDHRIEFMDARDRVFRVIVPTQEETEIRSGQRRNVTRKVFPGYIMVQMEITDDSWRVVRDTPGVTGFVSAGDPPRPVALGEEEVGKILRRMEGAAPQIVVGYTKGESVRITDGPFEDFLGTVDEVNPDRGKVRVLVSFFGRETPVELDFLQAEKL